MAKREAVTAGVRGKAPVGEVLQETAVTVAPYAFNFPGALEYSGLSESKLRQLIRDDVIAVRYEGAKLLILGDSLRRYVDSLPAFRVVERDCAAQRYREEA